MKKLFAILAVLVLFGTAAWAQAVGQLDWSDEATNDYKAYVVCQPELSPATDIVLGDFFINQEWTGSESMTFTLTGGATEGTDQVFAITYIEIPEAGFVVDDGKWLEKLTEVNITGSCGAQKTFTYTLKKAHFTATGNLTLTVGIEAELTSY
ncbi:MAG: hypothetical protein N2319_02400 [Candidatus Kapabacteria bacterium]|nr:hypothetical protein [Candidatus Kapabacteria bacterium]